MSIRHRPSLLGGFLWVGIGVLFLLGNLGYALDFWTLVSRYWPILLILLGLGKVAEYYLQKNSVSIRAGEIFGILAILLLGTAISKMSGSHVGQIIRNFPIEIGGTLVRPGQWFGESHTYTEEATYTMESPAIIRIENSNGTVAIAEGSGNEIGVRLQNVIFGNEALTKEIAGQIRLETFRERTGKSPGAGKSETDLEEKPEYEVFVVRTNRKELSSKNYRFNTNMEILVPADSDVQVRNSFGEIIAAEIDARLDLSTSHRPITVRDCSGQFTVSNQYAESLLTNLVGNLHFKGRGGVRAESIEGDLNVANEFSPVNISGIDGEVAVSNNEGSIHIDNVTKPVAIKARGTRVRVEDLEDDLDITASHRNVDILDVAADVSINSRYATVSLNDIGGSVTITSDNDRFNANDIRGQIDMKGRNSRIHANDVAGPLNIETTLKDVIVNDFGDACSVTNEYANVSVSAGSRNWGNVNIRNRNGRIDLFLPEDAAFYIDARARNGRIESDHRELQEAINKGDSGALKSSVKTGGPKIMLETEYNNISIHTHGSGRPQPVKDSRRAGPPGRNDL